MSFKEKQQNHHKNIRKQQISQIFNCKRKVLKQQHNSININAITLSEVWIQLKNHTENHSIHNIITKLTQMVNLMADDDPFSNGFDKEEQIHHFCLRLMNHIVYMIIPMLESHSQVHTRCRILCINLVSNILADQNIRNNQYVSYILQWFNNFYQSVEVWGIDEQIIEIGWTIGNLLRKNILINNSNENIINILRWVEQLIEITDYQMLHTLYQGIRIFFKQLHQYQTIENNYLTQIYLTQRLIILQKIMTKHLVINMGYKLLTIVLMLLDENIPYYIYIENQILIKMIDQCIVLFGSPSVKIVQANCKLLKDCLKYQSNNNNQYNNFNNNSNQYCNKYLRMHIINSHFNTILINLCWQNLIIKDLIFELILQLISDNNIDKFYHKKIIKYMINQGLDNIIIKMINSIKDIEIILKCLHISSEIIKVTTYHQHQNIIKSVENIMYQQGIIGTTALTLIHYAQNMIK